MAMDKKGNEPVTFSMEPDLIDLLNYCCGQRDISRSQAVREALKMWMAKEISNAPEFWERAAYGVRNRKESRSIV